MLYLKTRSPGLDNNYKIISRKTGQPCPRCYKLVVGDSFTTDAVEMGTKQLNTLKSQDFGTTALYAVPDASGYWKLVDNISTEKVALRVQKLYTAPNGVDPAFKFVVVKA